MVTYGAWHLYYTSVLGIVLYSTVGRSREVGGFRRNAMAEGAKDLEFCGVL